MSLYYIISFLGGLQGILLALVFLVVKKFSYAGKWLGIYLLVFSLGLFEMYAQEHLRGDLKHPVMTFLGFSNFLYGPLLYLFTRSLVLPGVKPGPRVLLHFLPFLLGFTLGLSGPPDAGSRVDEGLAELVLFEILVIQVLAYNFSAIRLLAKNKAGLLEKYASFAPGDLRWLQFFLWLITGTYILSFVITHMLLLNWFPVKPAYTVVQLLITLFIYLMSYKIMLNPGLFVTAAPALEEPVVITGDEVLQAEKYKRSGLKTGQAEMYRTRLLAYMDKEQPYREPDLILHDLALGVGISKHHLTQVLNEQFGKNFYEFINDYRVEAVKVMMTDPAFDRLTMEGIGQKAGFKSKTAFYQNFKKQAGLTPTAWKKTAAQKPARDESTVPGSGLNT